MQRSSLDGLEVSVLGLGTSRLASLGTRHSRAEVARLLDVASELGVDLIDTSDAYGSGACERLLGTLLGGQPARFRIATKGGLPLVDLPAPLRPLNQPARAALRRLGASADVRPETIRKRIEGSLRRLRRDHLELYFLHNPPPRAITDDVVEVLLAAVEAGKIGRFGISSSRPEVALEAIGIPACRVVQTRVSPAVAEPIEALAQLAEAGRDVVAHQVLATGGAREELLVGAAAERHGGRAGTLLRHALALPGVRVVLLGTVNPDHLLEAANALRDPVSAADQLVLDPAR